MSFIFYYILSFFLLFIHLILAIDPSSTSNTTSTLSPSFFSAALITWLIQVLFSILILVAALFLSWYIVWRLILDKIPFFQEIFGANKNKKKRKPQELILTKGKHAQKNYTKQTITPEVFNAKTTPKLKPSVVDMSNVTSNNIDNFSLDSNKPVKSIKPD